MSVCVKPMVSVGAFGLLLSWLALIGFQSGGMRPLRKRMPTKLTIMVDTGLDHSGIPALAELCDVS